jgi:prepilin-type N-terminal cleavage/methylation domain-containing protein
MKRHIKHQVSAGLFFLGKSLRVQSGTSRSGFTLIESLVAIIVISVTVVAISPPIFWAAATRVQNRRAEQALSIAQSSIDQVRGKIERGGVTTLELPALDTLSGSLRPNPGAPLPTAKWTRKQSITSACNTVSQISPGKPAVPATETTAAIPAIKPDQHYPALGEYLEVDTDGDASCNPEFLVQIFRNDGVCADGPCQASSVPGEERKPLVFSVGVRVYSAIAKDSPILLTEKARLTGTTGTGQTGSRPLAVLYSTVVKSDSSKSLDRYRELCKDSSGSKVCE